MLRQGSQVIVPQSDINQHFRSLNQQACTCNLEINASNHGLNEVVMTFGWVTAITEPIPLTAKNQVLRFF